MELACLGEPLACSINGIENSLFELFSFGQQCEMPEEAVEQDEPSQETPDEQESDDEEQDEEEIEDEEAKKVVKICPKTAKFKAINNVNGFSKVTNTATFKNVKETQGALGYIYSCMYKRTGVQAVSLYRFISMKQCSVQGPVIECD